VFVGIEQQGKKNVLALPFSFIIKVNLFFVLFDFFVHSVPIYQCHQIMDVYVAFSWFGFGV
jgi:hypothetical protein